MRFLLLDYGEAFFGGAAGGGKSDALLAGAAFGPFLSILGVKPVHSPTVICVNETKKRDLEIQFGYMELGQKNIRTIWFTNFLTGQPLAATNDGLFVAGKKVRASNWDSNE